MNKRFSSPPDELLADIRKNNAKRAYPAPQPDKALEMETLQETSQVVLALPSCTGTKRTGRCCSCSEATT